MAMGGVAPPIAAMDGGALPIASTHSLTSVVLPKPAGAEMRVSLRAIPSFRQRPALSSSIRRGRETSSGRAGGI